MNVSPDDCFTFGRDPFARVDRVRVNAAKVWSPKTGPGWECDWCGNSTNRLFCYGAWEDGINTRPWVDDKHAFCNVECHDSYHGRN